MDPYRTPDGVVVPRHAVRFTFARSGGPGGQHVNTASTKVRVTIDLAECGLDARRLERLLARLGPQARASSEAQRSQARNRDAALDRALRRIDDALRDAAPRRPTRPSAGARQRRRDAKQRQSERKARRRPPSFE